VGTLSLVSENRAVRNNWRIEDGELLVRINDTAARAFTNRSHWLSRTKRGNAAATPWVCCALPVRTARLLGFTDLGHQEA
jgi:hypothetical protein